MAVDAGAMNAEDFEREKKRLLSQREERERFSQEAEKQSRKRGPEEDALAGARGKRMLMGGRRCHAARGLPAPSAPATPPHLLAAPHPAHPHVCFPLTLS